MIRKVISGGQTGVDRAALDVGLQLGIPIGGSCPKGRRAEDGPINPKYPLKELMSSDYADRTRKNVVDADGTLILFIQALSGGTSLTQKFAQELKKPYLLVDLSASPQARKVINWINAEKIEVLNVAGPRESTHMGIYQKASAFLNEVLSLELRT